MIPFSWISSVSSDLLIAGPMRLRMVCRQQRSKLVILLGEWTLLLEEAVNCGTIHTLHYMVLQVLDQTPSCPHVRQWIVVQSTHRWFWTCVMAALTRMLGSSQQSSSCHITSVIHDLTRHSQPIGQLCQANSTSGTRSTCQFTRRLLSRCGSSTTSALASALRFTECLIEH